MKGVVRRVWVYLMGIATAAACSLALAGFFTAFLLAFVKEAHELEPEDFDDFPDEDVDEQFIALLSSQGLLNHPSKGTSYMALLAERWEAERDLADRLYMALDAHFGSLFPMVDPIVLAVVAEYKEARRGV